MAPLAEILFSLGHKVFGSDQSQSQNTRRLQSLGINVAIGHTATSVADAKTVVISSAIQAGNPDLLLAQENGARILHRSDILQMLAEKYQTIAIAGTHGKTTTAAMVAYILRQLGCDPIAAVGGEMRNFASHALTGKGSFFVAEADESDGSFTKYRPLISVITNVESDHMDYFGSVDHQLDTFAQFLQNTDKDGHAIVGWDYKLAREVGLRFERERLAFGFGIGVDVRATNYRQDGHIAKFTAIIEREAVDVSLKMVGKHNVLNALCALSVCRALELDVGTAAKALADFAGVERRLSLVHSDARLSIYDDYAHNPGKIAACIHSLRQTWPETNITVIYQPHRYSRIRTMYNESIAAFVGADRVLLLPVYAAGEANDDSYDASKYAHDIAQASSTDCTACAWAEAPVLAVDSLTESAVVITLGAGDVWKVGQEIKASLKDRSE